MCILLFAGKQIIGYVVKPGNTWEVIGTRSPQDPQVKRRQHLVCVWMYVCVHVRTCAYMCVHAWMDVIHPFSV